jgi:predicted ATPase
MFKKITLKNYRTHLDTTLDLKGLTLLIGGNNSGKSNLLHGIQHFAQLISRKVEYDDYFPHKHSLDSANTPMIFSCEWENAMGKVAYQIELYAISQEKVGCQEKIDISNRTLEHGYAQVSQELLLRRQLDNLSPVEKQLANDFFKSLAQVYSYNLHPALLKGLVKPLQDKEIDYANVNIHRDLGREGANFQALLKYVVRHDKETYEWLLEFLKFVVRGFRGLVIKDEQVFWQFDMQELPTTAISDGVIKGCAMVLLCALKNPPALIMIEEVENEISFENVRELLSWLRYASGKGKKMQFILTSHSPTFIRQFSDDLDAVYNIDLQSKNYKSLLTNLNDALCVDVKMERVDGYITKKDGRELAIVPPYKLTDLFYNGVLLNQSASRHDIRKADEIRHHYW